MDGCICISLRKELGNLILQSFLLYFNLVLVATGFL
ncbi:hypothetical protein SLEP1_g32174 [Rubroshorea leprosula]|uniref:Uncharacterized protein n=1 Tax=Rubroshorea leprosula TaxID=152421 RepID=A0AAV5KCF4_9ROSI|nr:hypothetical protein SLEP1_g32174 [Rubroshorea leprosula]